MIFKTFKYALAVTALVALTACGGGGSDIVAPAPVANATKYVDFNFVPSQIRVPGAGLRTMFIDEGTKVILVSDEIYWQEHSATGNQLIGMITYAREKGYRAAVSFTPYSVDTKAFNTLNGRYPDAHFGLTTEAKLIEAMKYVDIVMIDPYYFAPDLITPDELVKFSARWLDIIHGAGKEAWLITQGFAFGTGAERDKVTRLVADLSALGYDVITDFTAKDSGFDPTTNLDAVSIIKHNVRAVKPYTKETPPALPVLGTWNCATTPPTWVNFDGHDDWEGLSSTTTTIYISAGATVNQLGIVQAPTGACQ